MPKSPAPRRGARTAKLRRHAATRRRFIIGRPSGRPATQSACAGRDCSSYGSPQLHRDRRAERRRPRGHSARASRHRFVHAHFRVGPPPATLCVSSHLCGVLIRRPPLRGRTSVWQPAQNTAEMGRNAEQPGVAVDGGSKRARRPFRTPSPAKYRSPIRIKSRAGRQCERRPRCEGEWHRRAFAALAPRRGAGLGWGGGSGGSAALHHRLISYVPPARRGTKPAARGLADSRAPSAKRRARLLTSGSANTAKFAGSAPRPTAIRPR